MASNTILMIFNSWRLAGPMSLVCSLWCGQWNGALVQAQQAPVVPVEVAPAAAATLALPSRVMVEDGKRATVLVKTPTGSGSGFCIHSSGVFVTNAHVVGSSQKVDLVLYPGEFHQRTVKAKVETVARDVDLALLTLAQIPDAAPLTALRLGRAEDLFETLPVTVFGFPLGTMLAPRQGEMPVVTITTGHITALRKRENQLEEIQLDAAINEGNSGGPVLNPQGQVVGIVRAGIRPAAGLNFAVPVSRLQSLLEKPLIQVTPTSLLTSDLGKKREFRIKVAPLHASFVSQQPLTVEFTLRAPGAPRTFTATPIGGNIYRVEAVPVAPRSAQGPNSSPISGLTSVPTAARLTYDVTVKRGTTVVAQQGGMIRVERDVQIGAPSSPLAPAVKAPPLVSDKTVITLPGPIEDLAVGGGGRYLIGHLKKLQKLAVFDVNQAQVRYLSLTSDEAHFAAGAEKLVVVRSEANVIERYDLQTLQRELVVAKPQEGQVRSVSMGAASAGPVMIVSFAGFAKPSTSFFDLETLQKIEIEETTNRQWGSSWNDQAFQVRASPEGTVFTGWYNGLSPSGLHLLELTGDQSQYRNLHESVGYVVPGENGNRFYTSRGLFSSDLQPVGSDELQKSSLVPGYGEAFFLSLSLAPQQGQRSFSSYDTPQQLAVSVYSAADKRLLLTLPPLEELKGTEANLRWAREAMTLEKRIHFYPGANLLITLPISKDAFVLRRFNLVAELDKAGLDYLFVNSMPAPAVRQGQTYAYQLDVKSKHGGVTYTLSSGPPGATLSSNGRLVWNVPRDYEAREENIIISISDRSKQQIYHTFKVRVLPR